MDIEFDTPTPIFSEIIKCLDRQRPLISAELDLPRGTPEHAAASARAKAEDAVYDALLKKLAEESLATPSLQRVGELAALWRFRNLDADGKQFGIYDDDREGRALFAVIEKLTGVRPPARAH